MNEVNEITQVMSFSFFFLLLSSYCKKRCTGEGGRGGGSGRLGRVAKLRHI